MRYSHIHRRRGITLVGVLVVIIIVGVLIAVLISSLNAARESARLNACQNNLKQIGQAVLQYEAQFRSFPCGSRVRTDPKTGEWIGDWGPSWWVAVVDYDGAHIHRRQKNDAGEEASYLPTSTANNGLILNNYAPGYMICPSNPFASPCVIFPNPQQLTATSIILPAPTYVAISGTVPDVEAMQQKAVGELTWLPNPPTAVNPPQNNSVRCTSQANPEGTVSSNGIFPPNGFITIAAIRNGASNTLMVGEQSDYGIDATTGSRTMDIRSSAQYGAWIGLGNTGQQNFKKIDPSVPGTIAPYNCTTIAFPINSKIIQTVSSSKQSQITVPGLVGIPLNTIPPAIPRGLGNNNGIQSAHPGGANVLYGDGRVSFLNEDMDYRMLLYTGCRDCIHLIAGDGS